MEKKNLQQMSNVIEYLYLSTPVLGLYMRVDDHSFKISSS